MTAKELVRRSSQLYPHLEHTESRVRSAVTGKRDLFIYFGRTSTYGLRKWEAEFESIKGGTIRSIVAEILLPLRVPLHVDEITGQVRRYRKNTNAKSIAVNISLDRSGTFTIFGNSYIGLNSKDYGEETERVLSDLGKHKNWWKWMNELIRFRKIYPERWPESAGENINERSLFLFVQGIQIWYTRNQLELEKEIQVRRIGLPLKVVSFMTSYPKSKFEKLADFLTQRKRIPRLKALNHTERELYWFYINLRSKINDHQIDEAMLRSMSNSRLDIKIFHGEDLNGTEDEEGHE